MKKLVSTLVYCGLPVLVASAAFHGVFEATLLGIDDANIFFTYARNIVAGAGPVYSIGSPPAEGFSSALWLLVCTMGFWCTDNPYTLLHSITMLLCAGSIYTATRISSLVYNSRYNPLITTTWLLFFPGFFLWNTITLMDTALWVLLLLVSIYMCLQLIQTGPKLKTLVSFAIVSALLLITRPESLFWVPFLFLCVAWSWKSQQISIRRIIRVVLPSVCALLCFEGILLAWRLHTYGYPFPNTYYAKVTPFDVMNYVKGGWYCIRFVFSNPLLTGSIAALPYLLFRHRNQRDIRFFLPLMCVAGLLLPVLSGGDHFGSYRFYQILYPLLVSIPLLLVRTVRLDTLRSIASEFIATPSARTIIGAFVLCVVLPTWYGIDTQSKLHHEFVIAQTGRATGKIMNALFQDEPNKPVVGTIAAGGIGLTYRGTLQDLMGLNDPVMAHQSTDRKGYKNHAIFDKAIFYQHPPELLLPFEWQPALHDPGFLRDTYAADGFHNRVLKNLLTDQRFNQLYTLRGIYRDGNAITAFVRNDYLQYLAQHQYQLVPLDYQLLDLTDK